MATMARFQAFLDTYPDLLKRPLRVVLMQTHACWLEDSQGIKVIVRGADWAMMPSDGWAMVVLCQGQVHVLGIRDGRVLHVIPVIATAGTAGIPKIEPGA